jgi:hypothetical protein
MSFALTWLPKVLGDANLKVALVDGWENRGRGDVGNTLGVICHHTAGPRLGNMPSLDVLMRGRPDLSGPLAQLGLGRDGTFYVIAAGRCNHAGPGSWKGVDAGNLHFVGIEAEHTGNPADPWPAVQMDAYQRGAAAILKHANRAFDDCIGHKEWAPGRKPDPTFDMKAFRVKVEAILKGSAPAPVLIPTVEPDPPAGVAPRETLRRGSTGDSVKTLQTLLGLKVDGSFGPKTEAAVRAVQRSLDSVPDGIVGPRTWAALDGASQAAMRAAAASATAESMAATLDAATLPPTGDQNMANEPWPDKLASKMLAAYLRLRFGMSAGELMLRNPPMGAMPFFNNSASPEIRLAELGLVAGGILRFFAELQIPFEQGRNLGVAHRDLLQVMLSEMSPSAVMAAVIDDNYRFSDEA